jgi:hypothetical protein
MQILTSMNNEGGCIPDRSCFLDDVALQPQKRMESGHSLDYYKRKQDEIYSARK